MPNHQNTLRNPATRNLFLIIIFLILVGIGGLFFLPEKKKQANSQNKQTNSQKQSITQNKYQSFLNEIYQKIKTNYWKKTNDTELSKLFQLAIEKINNKPIDQNINNTSTLNTILLNQINKRESSAEKQKFSVDVATLVLANLEPFGRGGLFTEKKAQELQNNVSNVDESVNLYQILQVDEQTNQEKIEEKYISQKKSLEEQLQNPNLNKETKKETEEKLALTERAWQTLGNAQDKNNYDKARVESTVEGKILTDKIFYVHIKKMSPASFQDFQNTTKKVDTKDSQLNTLILDLRGNVGGSVDLMQWFLGPFIGQNQYAYDFFHQGEHQPYKTKVGWLPSLVRYKKVVILIDSQVQSSGEVMAATLKKYNVGVLIGETTKGWGTIEKIFPLENQISNKETYSMFLVHSLTLRPDGQPIEGRGVDPHININDKNWQSQLNEYYNFPELTQQIQKIWFEK